MTAWILNGKFLWRKVDFFITISPVLGICWVDDGDDDDWSQQRRRRGEWVYNRVRKPLSDLGSHTQGSCDIGKHVVHF